MMTNNGNPEEQAAVANWYEKQADAELQELMQLEAKVGKLLRKAGDTEMYAEEEVDAEDVVPKKKKPGMYAEEGDEEEADVEGEGDEEEKGVMGIVTKPIKKLIGKAADMEDDEDAVEPTEEELAASMRNRERRMSRVAPGDRQSGQYRQMGEKGMAPSKNKRGAVRGGSSGDMSGDMNPLQPMTRDELMAKLFGGSTGGKKKGQVARPAAKNRGEVPMKDVKPLPKAKPAK